MSFLNSKKIEEYFQAEQSGCTCKLKFIVKNCKKVEVTIPLVLTFITKMFLKICMDLLTVVDKIERQIRRIKQRWKRKIVKWNATSKIFTEALVERKCCIGKSCPYKNDWHWTNGIRWNNSSNGTIGTWLLHLQGCGTIQLTLFTVTEDGDVGLLEVKEQIS